MRRVRVARAAAIPLVLLSLLPLLANWQAVSGWLQHDPIYMWSGLARDVVPGPLAGFTSQDPNDGITTEALGHLAAEQWLSGRVPWWNPYGGVGLPLAAEMQCSALFLPFVLLLHFAQGPLLLKLAMQMVAGLATYALLRALGLGRLAAFTGGALYALNGTFAWFGHAPMLPIAFLPLLLLGIEGARRATQEGRRGGWAWVAVALACSLYAGFPETAYIDGLLALAWAGLRAGQLRGAARTAFCAKIAGGGVAGLLLAAPVVLPFLQLLRLGHVDAVRDLGGFGGVVMPPYGLVVLLSPYTIDLRSLGVVFAPSNPFSWISARLGGYLSLAVLLLAVLGLAGRREYGLRWLLLTWCVLALGRTAGVPGIIQLVNAVPFIAETMFFRYAPPSWELAATMLAAFTLDDWQCGEVGRGILLLALVVVFWIATTAVLVAQPLIAMLLERVPHYAWWLWGSLLWSGAVAVASGLLLLGAPGWRRGLTLAALLVFDALAVFTVPGFSAPRHAELDRGPVRFLARNLGLQRFHTLGPLRPNYGAYFGLATVDADYVPAPRRWAEHVARVLDPYAASPLTLGTSAYPLYLGKTPAPAAMLREHLAGHEELGVRYVLAPRDGTNPFVETVVSDTVGPASRAHPLFAGQVLTGMFPAQRLKAGRVTSFGVLIGTYAGAANGHLNVELCADAVCREGTTNLAGATDGASLDVSLNSPLDVEPGAALRYRIVHTDGPEAVALWLWPEPGATPGAPLVPRVTLTYAGPVPPARVYADDLVDIYELPHPKPYFEIRDGNCTLAPNGREALTAVCTGPALLVRRELAYPGWHAMVNGVAVAVEEAAPLFQAIRLPAGVSRVRFRYWPPGIGWAYTAALLGLGATLAGAGRVHLSTWHRGVITVLRLQPPE